MRLSKFLSKSNAAFSHIFCMLSSSGKQNRNAYQNYFETMAGIHWQEKVKLEAKTDENDARSTLVDNKNFPIHRTD